MYDHEKINAIFTILFQKNNNSDNLLDEITNNLIVNGLISEYKKIQEIYSKNHTDYNIYNDNGKTDILGDREYIYFPLIICCFTANRKINKQDGIILSYSKKNIHIIGYYTINIKVTPNLKDYLYFYENKQADGDQCMYDIKQYLYDINPKYFDYSFTFNELNNFLGKYVISNNLHENVIKQNIYFNFKDIDIYHEIITLDNAQIAYE